MCGSEFRFTRAPKRRTVSHSIVAFVLAACGTLWLADIGAAQDGPAPPLPGKLVDVGGDEALALRAERQNVTHALIDLPLVVVTRGLPVTGPMAAQREAERKQHQTELASLSTSGRQITAVNSGHHIQIDEPAVVVEAIRDVAARLMKR